MGSSRQQEQQRMRIAGLAARHIVESGIIDFHLAKRKAVQQLGVSEKCYLPSNKEIESALIEYQGLFHADTQPDQLRKLRQTAIHAMEFLQQFNPRLAGDVLSGAANEHSSVELHVFADYPEQVNLFLMEQKISYSEKSRRIKYDDVYQQQPLLQITADNIEVDIIVFPQAGLRRAPDSPVDGQPMARAGLQAVNTLLQVS